MSIQFQPTQPVRLSWPTIWKKKVLGLMDRIYWACNRPIPLCITVLGPENSGKTSVIRRYAGDIFYEDKMEPPERVFRLMSLLKIHNKLRRFNVNIVEVSKSKMTREEYELLLRKTSGILLIYSTDLPDSFNEIRSIIKRTTNNDSDAQTVLVVGNKTEVSTSMNQVEQNTGIKDEVQSAGLNYFTVSAKLNWGVNDAFDELIESCAKNKVRTFKPLKRKRKSRKSKKTISTESKLLSDEEDNTFDEG